MKKNYFSLLILLISYLLIIFPAFAVPNINVQNCTAVTAGTCTLAHAFGRGVNLGNMLEAPREGDYGLRVEPIYIDKAASVFTTVRLPVRWSNHAALTADATLDEFFAARVDKVVDSLLAKGLYVILDMHHYRQIFGDRVQANEPTVAPEVLEVRLVNMWRQIAQRYKDRSPKLVFELLNEPHGRLDGEPWNILAKEVLSAVRASNSTRTVIIGPTFWNNVRDLPKLQLPPDKNLVVAIHNYEPFPFTHQGAEWMPQNYPVGVTCCSTEQRKKISDALNIAVTWNKKYGYPLHLGEFGSFNAADMHSREVYTRFLRDEAEKHGIGWTYWEFASSFGVFAPKTGDWVEPIRRALLD
jgi:endoglucanase